jgi:hypothetical protein
MLRRVRLLPKLLALLALCSASLAAAQPSSSCFQGTSTTPYVQKVVYAPNTGYYVKAYPAANGAMSVFVSNGGREVLFYVGYVLALEADYIAASRTTLVVATVSDRQCGPPSDLYVRAGQLNDGAAAFTRPYSFHSPHATGAYHRDLCATGGTQTLIVMEGDNPVLPTNAPYVPGADTDAFARMQCQTLIWSATSGFVKGSLQGCGDCGDLDGKPCSDPCFKTQGVMRAGQCDLSAATPLCDFNAGKVCNLNGGAHCVAL